MRSGAVLLAGNRYPNHSALLWNLPGGRQESGELLPAALIREAREETGMTIAVNELLYLSESYDLESSVQFTNATFAIASEDDPRLPASDPHVVALEWVPIAELAARIAVPVVRDPLIAFLAGSKQRYWGVADAGITIEFADAPRPPTSAS